MAPISDSSATGLPASTSSSEDIGLGVVLAYAMPTLGVGLMFFLVSLYLMIFKPGGYEFN